MQSLGALTAHVSPNLAGFFCSALHWEGDRIQTVSTDTNQRTWVPQSKCVTGIRIQRIDTSDTIQISIWILITIHGSGDTIQMIWIMSLVTSLDCVPVDKYFEAIPNMHGIPRIPVRALNRFKKYLEKTWIVGKLDVLSVYSIRVSFAGGNPCLSAAISGGKQNARPVQTRVTYQ